MPKKKDEEPPPPEELLARHGGGFEIGGEVYWVQFSKQLESGVEVKPGMKGTLEALGDLTEEMAIDLVQVKFEDYEELQPVPLSSLSINPPPLDMLDTLSTGLKLPLRGVDIEKIWALGDDNFEKQSEMIVQMLGLNERYGTGRREIVCDFHLYNLVHAKSLCLTTTQGAVFHGIMEEMLTLMRNVSATPDTRPEDMCTAEQCFNRFQQLILSHSRQDPPSRLGIFRDSEVRLLTDFASVTLFKHYLLYQYCINFDREIETLRFNPNVERPSPPPDLSLGTKKTERQVASRQRQKEAAENGHADRDMNMEAPAGPEETAELTEEEKIEKLVAEKLKETEDKLNARLEQAEAEFMRRVQEEKEAAAGKKGKK
jgi:hypothetical protein